jgi:peptidoglycan/xylan/chitin deacetylase (PgdA/CDA1 family)
MKIIQTGKRAVAAILYYSRVINIIKRLNIGSNIILSYHRILPQGCDDIAFIQPGMYVTSETFERQMEFISSHYHLINLEEGVKSCHLKNACMITFDDGWADNYKHAFPILKKHGIPATIFLVTNMIDTNKWPWPDRICYYIHSIPLVSFVDIFRSSLRKMGRESYNIIGSSWNKWIISEMVLEYLKRLDSQALCSIMADLDFNFAQYKEKLSQKRPWLNWDEISEMAQHGISYGSHTHNHMILNQIPISEARRELVLSKEILGEKIGKPVTMFCYPNGNYNTALMRLVEECGYEIAVTTKRGSIDESDSMLALKRIMIHNDMTFTIPMFACVLSHNLPFF